MPQINQLNTLDTPNDSDLLPIYSQQNGDARKVSVGNLRKAIESGNAQTEGFVTQYSFPAGSGFTTLVVSSKENIWLILRPTAPFNAGTIKLPPQSDLFDGQRFIVNTTEEILNLTIDGNGANLSGQPVTIAKDGSFELRYDAGSNIWYRVSGTDSSALAVTYNPAGAAAVATTVQTKLREFVSVKDFGAVGDGVTDDAAAIQAAVNSTASNTLVFPAGTYVIGASIKPRANQKWIGTKGQTTIKIVTALGTGGINCILWNKATVAPTDPALVNFHAEGIIFDANGHECPAQINGLTDCSFVDCVFKNGNSYGFAAQARPGWTNELDQKRVQFTRCGFENNGFSGQQDTYDGIDVKYGEDWTLSDCWAYGNADVGFNFRGKNIQLVSCVAKQGVRGFLLQSAEAAGFPSFIELVNCIAQSASSAGFTAQSSINNSNNCQISNSTATNCTIAGFEISSDGASRVIFTGCVASGSLSGFIINEVAPEFVLVQSCVATNNEYGVRVYGSNLTLANSIITANTSYGYAEESTANDNLVLANNRIYGNGTNYARNGTTLAITQGLSVINEQSYRAFPGSATGLELKTDVGANNSSIVAVGDAASVDLRLISKGNGDVAFYKDNGARQIGVFRESGSGTVNYPDFVASTTGTPVQIRATGSDANVDLQLNPQGTTGHVRFGAHTASADVAISGYIEIKDLAGTVRKLAVIS